MKRIEIILPVALILLSCGDGRKASSESKGETTEFEVVGKKEKPSEDTVDEPVSVSSILSGKESVTMSFLASLKIPWEVMRVIWKVMDMIISRI